jgi:hypothetical protein
MVGRLDADHARLAVDERADTAEKGLDPDLDDVCRRQ